MADRQGFYFQGEEKLRDWLRKVEEKGGNFQELFDQLGDVLLNGVHERFREQRAPDGRPWQKSWRAIATGGKTLQDSGILLNSIHTRLNKNGVSMLSNLKYAKLMHFGGVVKPKHKKFLKFKTPMGGWMFAKQVTIPARPIFGVSEDDAQNMLTTIESYLEELLKDAK